MKFTKKDKNNLLEFLKRVDLKGIEALTFINLISAIEKAEEIENYE